MAEVGGDGWMEGAGGVTLQDGRTDEFSREKMRTESEGGRRGGMMQGRCRVQQFWPRFTDRTGGGWQSSG